MADELDEHAARHVCPDDCRLSGCDELDEAVAEELEAAGPPRTTTDVIRDGRAILARHEELHEAVRVIGHHLNTLPPLERAAFRRYMARVYFPTL